MRNAGSPGEIDQAPGYLEMRLMKRNAPGWKLPYDSDQVDDGIGIEIAAHDLLPGIDVDNLDNFILGRWRFRAGPAGQENLVAGIGQRARQELCREYGF